MTGPARPTLAQVAALAGVAPSTASLVFSGNGPVAPATRAKVLAAAATLDYRGPDPIARSLRTGTTGVVGVVIGDRLQVSFRDPLMVRVLDGVATELGERGFGMLLIPLDPLHDPAPLPAALSSGPMDAAILTCGTASDPAVRALTERGIPLVSLDGPELPGVPRVGIDDEAGMSALVRHLRAKGHERIGVVSLPLDFQRRHGPVTLTAGREAPYLVTRRRLDQLARLGIEPDTLIEARTSGVEEGRRAGLELLAHKDRPTAIMALSDLLAAGVVLAARDLHLAIPHDVAVTGFDGLDLPWLEPEVLTSVGQPLGTKGRIAAQLAASLLAGDQPGSVQLPVEFKRGNTT